MTQTAEVKKEKLGDSLPQLFREFEVLEMIPVKKREKKVFTAAEVEERAQRAERRKKKAAAGERNPDPENDEDDDTEKTPPMPTSGTRTVSTFPSPPNIPCSVGLGPNTYYSADAVDLSRAKRGLSFLDSDDAKLGDRHRREHQSRRRQKASRSGSVLPAALEAQQIKTDIQDEIRRFISVGYMVNEYTLAKSSKEEGDTYRATRWTPLEASSVGVPADPTVGNDRKSGDRQYPVDP